MGGGAAAEVAGGSSWAATRAGKASPSRQARRRDVFSIVFAYRSLVFVTCHWRLSHI
jgi:hypothetical protein